MKRKSGSSVSGDRIADLRKNGLRRILADLPEDQQEEKMEEIDIEAATHAALYDAEANLIENLEAINRAAQQGNQSELQALVRNQVEIEEWRDYLKSVIIESTDGQG